MVRFPHGAGVEDAHRTDLFVAGHVGMAMKSKMGLGRHVGHWFMAEIKRMARAFEQQAFRSDTPRVAVAADSVDRRSEGAQGFEDVSTANVAEVPDFVRPGQDRKQGVWKAIVGVGNDGNAHAQILEAARSARKPGIVRIN